MKIWADLYSDGDLGKKEANIFKEVYAAAPAARLTSKVPSFNFTADDIVAMQQLCGYETVIRNSSNFCSLDLFTSEEWLGFEYMSTSLLQVDLWDCMLIGAIDDVRYKWVTRFCFSNRDSAFRSCWHSYNVGKSSLKLLSWRRRRRLTSMNYRCRVWLQQISCIRGTLAASLVRSIGPQL